MEIVLAKEYTNCMAVTIYTDESGTHSNRYMVICALIVQTPEAKKRITNLMRRQLVKHRTPEYPDELHASKLSMVAKQDVTFHLSKKHDHYLAYIVVDKNHVVGELKTRPNLCFNYMFNLLFKRLVSTFRTEDVTIFADNRSVSAGSKNSLPEYVMTQAYAEWGYKGNLTINFCDSRDVKGLQAVDIVANAVYAKYNLEKKHLYNMHSGHFVERVKFPYAKFGLDT